jgi:ArsR family transcriptional regulator
MDLLNIIKALDDENRLRILNLLKTEELCVGSIEYILSMTQSNASRHLNKLNILGVVTNYKKAQWIYYKLNPMVIEQFPFLKELIFDEIPKLDKCKVDSEKLKEFMDSGMTCEDLKECNKREEE